MDLFNNLWVISECLLDQKRTEYFKNAIDLIVKPGDIVVDAGTGSGILAIFAAKAGAKKVYAIEYSKEIAAFAKKNIKNNKLDSIIEIVNQDVSNFTLPNNTATNVLTIEMMDTGLVAEQQAHALQCLKKNGVIDKATKIIPNQLDCAIQLVDYNFNFYGTQLKFSIAARNDGVLGRVKSTMSDVTTYKSIDMSNINHLKIAEKLSIPVTKNGTVNSFILTSLTHIGNQTTWGTSDMNMPYVIPLSPAQHSKGDIAKLQIEYTMSHGFEKFNASWIT